MIAQTPSLYPLTVRLLSKYSGSTTVWTATTTATTEQDNAYDFLENVHQKLLLSSTFIPTILIIRACR